MKYWIVSCGDLCGLIFYMRSRSILVQFICHVIDIQLFVFLGLFHYWEFVALFSELVSVLFLTPTVCKQSLIRICFILESNSSCLKD